MEAYEIDSLFMLNMRFLDWVFGARTRVAGSSGETATDGIVKADPIRSNSEKREE